MSFICIVFSIDVDENKEQDQDTSEAVDKEESKTKQSEKEVEDIENEVAAESPTKKPDDASDKTDAEKKTNISLTPPRIKSRSPSPKPSSPKTSPTKPKKVYQPEVQGN